MMWEQDSNGRVASGVLAISLNRNVREGKKLSTESVAKAV
jgi:hypothetical protein